MAFKEALKVFVSALREEHEIERKTRAFIKLTKRTLNYPLLEQIVAAASRQNPGFYSVITFDDGTKWEFGIREKPMRAEGETF
jgi:hypothetical protein